jgi:hypothetical protein
MIMAVALCKLRPRSGASGTENMDRRGRGPCSSNGGEPSRAQLISSQLAFDSFPKYTVEGVDSLVVLDLTMRFAETWVESVEVRPLPTPRRVGQSPVASVGGE